MAIAQVTSESFRSDSIRPNGIRIVNQESPPNGTRSLFGDTEYIYYDGYWVRYYEPLEESWASRKALIDNLTRRTFHHTEPGINTPGKRLDSARCAYEEQTDPVMKRVNAAMLAGALFNRATDIFTAIVELEEKGVKLSRDNELMRDCGQYFKEALELGRDVKHHSGEEGIDELWGEPFRAFTIPITTYYESRFIKVSQTMANIDLLAQTLKDTFTPRPEFAGLSSLIDTYAEAAKHECETMKSDACIFKIWPKFIATGEHLGNFRPKVAEGSSQHCQFTMENAMLTVITGRNLINWVARARVPMRCSTKNYIARCQAVKERLSTC